MSLHTPANGGPKLFPPIATLGSYDLHNTENVDRIAESSYKNVIYSVMPRNLAFATEKGCTLKLPYGLVSVKINMQKDC